MKALLMRKPGDVVLTEYPTPVPGKNQVLVRIHAAGICVNVWEPSTQHRRS